MALKIAGSGTLTDEVADRFGRLLNVVRSSKAAPGLIEELWAFARSAYLDSRSLEQDRTLFGRLVGPVPGSRTRSTGLHRHRSERRLPGHYPHDARGSHRTPAVRHLHRRPSRPDAKGPDAPGLCLDRVVTLRRTDAMARMRNDIAAPGSTTVQTFALALLELITNVVKYGALAQAQGHLDIRWRLERAQADGRPWLCVDGRESRVVMPAAGAGPQGDGSGRALIERVLAYQLGAGTTYVMAADGVHCTIALSLSRRLAVRETVDA